MRRPFSASRRPELGPRAVTYPYRRIARVEATPGDGPDPYGNPDPEWMRIDWRRHLRRIDVDGTEVNFAEIGEGPPIVFIHGLNGCWQNWLENMPHMAALGHRTVALDLPGFGASPMPPWEISIPTYRRFVTRFCEQAGIAACTIVGNSMGGFAAAEVAVSEPELTDRLVLVSAAGISHASMRREPVVAAARASALTSPLMLGLDLPSMRRPGLRRLAFGGVMRHPERLRPELLAEFMGTAIGPPGFLPAVGALTGYDLLHRLAEIEVPTLVVWGRDDLVVPASDAVGFVERIRGSRLEVFADCGHAPVAERPVRFNRTLERFIRGSAAAPAAG